MSIIRFPTRQRETDIACPICDNDTFYVRIDGPAGELVCDNPQCETVIDFTLDIEHTEYPDAP